MKDIKVTDSVKYIGVDDHDIDLFESQYVVPNGVSYNSYVILDEKVAVMDTVDACKTDEWLVNLEEALDGRNVDYIVVSHMEPDHAATLGQIAENRKCISKGGELDYSKAAALLIDEFRSGKLGQITLERPKIQDGSAE